MTTTNVLVLGAGYTGTSAALGIAARTGSDVHVTLVNPSARFTERLRLHQTASGQELAHLDIPTMLEGTGIEFVQGCVTAIDADARTVRIDDERVLGYDVLVHALGAVSDTTTVPGADTHAFTLDSAHDAGLLAQRLASLPDGAPVVVVGNGLTGVEAAAEIAEQHPRLTVHLLGRGEPGAMMGPRARAYLERALDRLGVQSHTGVDVVKVFDHGVDLADGEHVRADAVLWTTGVRVSPLAAAAGLEVDERGRILTDPSLRSVSHPEVFAVGDAAAVRQGFGVLHGTCQSGIPTAVHAARTIARILAGKPARPFRFGYIHQPVGLGRQDAVIQFTRPDDTPGRFFLTGRWAVAYKEAVSSSPWQTFAITKRTPSVTTLMWRRGGAATRTV
ncbi:NAD(P)/FAD-dependent oxidoreductase [Pseudonocardia sp. TRM90224]|uniref:NAD(P)/FAD-dependent oxidoreductase n=1 Tax=Pseudonocardia sp. TRM90224 TaxID=2812678 RepID=UPI001E4DEE21|nr:FAD-dependent oxidoreductase [Pseudonocardia sp. TRM90224]